MRKLVAIAGLTAGLAILAATQVAAQAAGSVDIGCMSCVARDLFNAFFPPTVAGTLAAGAAAAAAGALGGPLSNAAFNAMEGGASARDALNRANDPGNDVSTPSTGEIPDVGDIVYFPGQGASKVKNVSFDPDSYDSRGNPGTIVVETELGIVKYGTRP